MSEDNETPPQVNRLRLLFLSVYAGTGFLTLFLHHSAAGQYIKELGLPFSFEWTIREGAIVGSAFCVCICLLTWILTRSFDKKKALRSAALNGSLIFASFIATYPFTPGWSDYAFVGQIVLFGLVVSISTYWYHVLGKPDLYHSITAMKLQHERSLQNLRDLKWAFVFVAASFVFSSFITFVEEVPKNLRHTSAYQIMMAITTIGIIYLLAGVIINLIHIYLVHVRSIEKRIDEMDTEMRMGFRS